MSPDNQQKTRTEETKEPIAPYKSRVKSPHGVYVNCELHGGTAEQFRFLKQAKALCSDVYASALVEALAGVVNGEERLVIALGYRDENTRARESQKLIADIWRADGGLGPYPLLDILAEHERTRGIYYDRYRDHLVHQVRVWLMGLYFIAKFEFLRNALVAEAQSEPVPEHGTLLSDQEALAESLRRWKIAALWHDIGYVFEVQHATDEGKIIQTSLKALDISFDLPLSELFKGTLSPDREANALKVARSRRVNINSWQSLTAVSDLTLGDYASFWETLHNRTIPTQLGTKNAIKAYYDLCDSGKCVPPERKRFIDHGVAGALLLLYLHDFIKTYISQLHELALKDYEELAAMPWARIKHISAETEKATARITAAAAAIALHNIYPDLIRPAEAVNNNLTLDAYKIPVATAPGQPNQALAYLLILADGLQEWDRPTLMIPKEPQKLPVIDQEFLVTASAANVYLEYLPGADAGHTCGDLKDKKQQRIILDKLIAVQESLERVLAVIPEANPLILQGIAHPLATESERVQDVVLNATSDVDLKPYLNSILQECGTIVLRGIMAAGKARKAFEVPIQEIYAPLRIEGGDSDEELWYLLSGRAVLRGQSSEFPEEPSQRGTGSSAKSQGLLLVGEPGSGKSTFLRLTAAVLAHALLEEPGFETHEAVKILRDEQGNKLIPVYIRLSEFIDYIQKSPESHPKHAPVWLKAYLLHWLEVYQSGIPEEVFEQWLKEGKLLLLLDGLDEIPNSKLRSEVGKILTNAFQKNVYGACRVCITSRPLPEEDFPVPMEPRTLQGLSDEAVKNFLQRWSAYVSRDAEGKHKTPEEYAEDLLTQANRSHPSIRRMVRNPLMLTCLAVIHWNERRLPEQRAELFNAVVTWLLRARRLNDEESPQLNEAFNVRLAYKKLALHMQNYPGGRVREIDLVKAAEAIAELFPGSKEDQQVRACGFLNVETLRTGIVNMRGSKKLSFWHLTFQEYLAAELLSDSTEQTLYSMLSRAKLYDREWREVVLLLGSIMGVSERTDKLLGYILEKSSKTLPEQARAYALASALVYDLKPYGYKPSPSLQLEALEQKVMAIFTVEGVKQAPSLKLRVEVAEALGQSGDPRLRRQNWVRIPDEYVKKLPNPPIELWMGAYQVTVEEYAKFVEDGGYDPDGFGKEWIEKWKEAIPEAKKRGYDWLHPDDYRRTRPDKWVTQLETPNRPVVYVTWYEAEAYCRWLTRQQDDRYLYCLPTEVEWQLAARGQLKGKKYPWGDEHPGQGDEARANYEGAGLKCPCPVGLFPTGATLWIDHCFLYDMAGNVWEWCKDEMDSNLNPQDGGLFRPLRGGSYWYDDGDVAVVFRNRSHAAVRDVNCGFRVCRVLLSPRPAQDH